MYVWIFIQSYVLKVNAMNLVAITKLKQTKIIVINGYIKLTSLGKEPKVLNKRCKNPKKI